MNLTEDIKKEIMNHAKEESPNESCGLIIIKKGRTKYKRCSNISEIPKHTFIISTDDYIKAEEEGEIVGVAHSHPFEQPEPSIADRVACEKSQIPWFIVNPIIEKWGYCEPSGFELPYVGRDFQYGIVDCYSLIRDYYKKELKIILNDYFRSENDFENGNSLYENNFMKEGFVKIPVDEIKKHDLLFMHLEANLPNHGAIYIGDQQVLHHVGGRLSSRDLLGEYYMKNIAFAARHKSLL
jgi:proteasome lid subunit RPN8/RPN11